MNIEYKGAEALIKEFSSLTSQILDSRLALSRLRTSYPPPRLSVASAKATLETQIETMTALDSQLSDNASKMEELKERVQATATDVERTRVERATKEEEAKQAKAEEDDERISGLYDWYVACIISILDCYFTSFFISLKQVYCLARITSISFLSRFNDIQLRERDFAHLSLKLIRLSRHKRPPYCYDPKSVIPSKHSYPS